MSYVDIKYCTYLRTYFLHIFLPYYTQRCWGYSAADTTTWAAETAWCWEEGPGDPGHDTTPQQDAAGGLWSATEEEGSPTRAYERNW